MALGKGAQWFLFRCHLKGTLFESRERGRKVSHTHAHTHTARGSTYTHMLTRLNQPMSRCWGSRCEDPVVWAYLDGVDVGAVAPKEAIGKETFEAL